MSPSRATQLAARLFPYRGWFLLVAIAGTALLCLMLVYAPDGGAAVATALAGPVIFAPGTLLGACLWFHPEHGSIQPGSKVMGMLPKGLQRVMRWYASFAVSLFLIVGALLWPVLSLVPP